MLSMLLLCLRVYIVNVQCTSPAHTFAGSGYSVPPFAASKKEPVMFDRRGLHGGNPSYTCDGSFLPRA
jgi:hypothetical protein